MYHIICLSTSNVLTDRSKAMLLLWIIFVVCVSCHTVLFVPCSLVVTFQERADLLALLYVIFSDPYGVMGQVWYLIVWIADLCLFLTLYNH